MSFQKAIKVRVPVPLSRDAVPTEQEIADVVSEKKQKLQAYQDMEPLCRIRADGADSRCKLQEIRRVADVHRAALRELFQIQKIQTLENELRVRRAGP